MVAKLLIIILRNINFGHKSRRMVVLIVMSLGELDMYDNEVKDLYNDLGFKVLSKLL